MKYKRMQTCSSKSKERDRVITNKKRRKKIEQNTYLGRALALEEGYVGHADIADTVIRSDSIHIAPVRDASVTDTNAL